MDDFNMQLSWSEDQRHCLLHMGIERSYFKKDDAPSVIDKSTLQDREKKSSPLLSSAPSNTVPQNRANPTKLSSSPSEVNTSSIAPQPTTHITPTPSPAQKPAIVSTTARQVRDSGAKNPTPAVAPLSKQYGRQLWIIGNQEKYDNLLLGKRLIADLSLYLNYHVEAFDYISFLEEENISAFSLRLHERHQYENVGHTNESSSAATVISYIIPQGEEQETQLSDLFKKTPELLALQKTNNIMLLPSLTKLLSYPEAKAELFVLLKKN